MLYGYWQSGRTQGWACFEYFFRDLPPDSGFAVFAGLAPLLSYLEHFRFNEEDLDYLASLQRFEPGFLEYLRDFRLVGSVWAPPEGSVVFPHETILRIEAPLAEAQVLETAVLNALNYPTLVASKTARICLAANGDEVMEFGVRRAQGPDGGLSGSRAAYIGGAGSTSNVLAGKLYGIPVAGTHAHSWVMSFEHELEAFRAYAAVFPDAPLFLVDTYDTLTSGLPNALTVLKELRDAGHPVRAAIRLDSGDLARLSKAAYRMFTQAGFADPLIVASNELDEDLIADLKRQGAKINSWGVGTHLITSSTFPALGGVYKLMAVQGGGGGWQPRIKLSSNLSKMTDPARKRVVRYRDGEGRPLADLMFLVDEDIPAGPQVPYVSRMDLAFLMELSEVASAEELLAPVLREGRRVGTSPPLSEVRDRARQEIARLPEELRRLRNPEIYRVGLSPALGRMKAEMIRHLPGMLPQDATR